MFLKASQKISAITFVTLCFLPIGNLDLFDGYMRYGYALLPVVDIFFFKVVEKKEKRIFNIILYSVALVEMFIFGARGCLFAHALFVFFICFSIYRPQSKLMIKTFIGGCGLIVFYNLEFILVYLKQAFNNMGYHVYAIDKYLLQLENGFEDASSGRDVLWNDALEVMSQHPFFGGDISGRDEYYHNFFLQLGAEFGWIVLILVGIAIIVMIAKIWKLKDKYKKYVFFLIFSIAFGRLLFSSSYWLRPELWLLIGMYFSNNFTRTRSLSN